jgi:hypothetical protein
MNEMSPHNRVKNSISLRMSLIQSRSAEKFASLLMSVSGSATILIQQLVTSSLTAQPLTEIVKFVQAPALNAMQ